MAKTPMRLPPVRVLRVRNPNKKETNPCFTAMSSVLGELPSSAPPYALSARLLGVFSVVKQIGARKKANGMGGWGGLGGLVKINPA